MTELSYGAPPPRRRKRIFLWLLGLLAAYLVWEAVTWPDVAALAHAHPKTTAFIESYRGWGIFGPKKKVEWVWVPYSRISPSLKRAVLVNEDMRFFSHSGFDEAEIKASLQDAWTRKSLPRGASTITQQVAKNLWLSGSYNPLRKVKEAILTKQLEANLSKRRILEIYLNVAEFGEGVYGAEAASRHYYHRSAASLTHPRGAPPPLLPPLGGEPHRPPGRRALRRPPPPQELAPRGPEPRLPAGGALHP